MVRIVDCTLRDGGYYTNWDFDRELVDTYVDSFNHLPVDYFEVGYRAPSGQGYLGEYFYLPPYLLEDLRTKSAKKLALMLNEKDVRAEQADALLAPCRGLVDMVRIAVDPGNFCRALTLAAQVKRLGFEVSFNVMYMSKWRNQPEFLQLLGNIDGIADCFYMVDSYGGVYPSDVKEAFDLVRSKTEVEIGFHAHNNLELALINTLTAVDLGAGIVDATVTGMGRGAGNLKTELLLTALHARGEVALDFDALSRAVDAFSRLQGTYGWGTSLPYMISGANSLPQRDVMDWVGKRLYAFNSIIRALHNQARGVQDNQRLPTFDRSVAAGTRALIVGGGPSAVHHARAITNYLRCNEDIVVVHASSKNAMVLRDVCNPQVFCLVGNEGYRMEDVFSGRMPARAVCVLPPYPRKMGTYVPVNLRHAAFELPATTFAEKYAESHTAIALQSCLEIGATEIEVVGYDGYSGAVIGNKEQELLRENEYLFTRFKDVSGLALSGLTPTTYRNLDCGSIYTRL